MPLINAFSTDTLPYFTGRNPCTGKTNIDSVCYSLLTEVTQTLLRVLPHIWENEIILKAIDCIKSSLREKCWHSEGDYGL